MIAPLKHQNNFWRTLEMLVINCEINLILTLFGNCVIAFIANANQAATLSVTDTKVFVPVVTLSTEDNEKKLQQLKSGFKRTVNWNKYQSKVSIEIPNQYLDQIAYLIQVFRELIGFLLYHVKIMQNEQVTINIFFSNCRNKRSQCYDRWKKLF